MSCLLQLYTNIVLCRQVIHYHKSLKLRILYLHDSEAILASQWFHTNSLQYSFKQCVDVAVDSLQSDCILQQLRCPYCLSEYQNQINRLLQFTQHMFLVYVVGHGISLDPNYRLTYWLYLDCILMATGYCFRGQQQKDQHILWSQS